VSSENARQVLRSIWEVQGDPVVELDEECSPNKACKNVQGMTFDGFAGDGADLRTAWRATLAREGKLSNSNMSIRDLVLGSNDSN
jgi:hypothetical protein